MILSHLGPGFQDMTCWSAWILVFESFLFENTDFNGEAVFVKWILIMVETAFS